MPGFVNSNTTDLFISYSHVDDAVFDDEPAGWVTRLVRNVEKLLAMKLGRRESFELWMDGRLTGNEPVTESIEGTIREAAVFVLILSPGYLASIWCARELEAFRAEVCRRLGDDSRVFVVEFGEVERPAELARPRGYRFWQKDSVTNHVAQLGFPKLMPGDEAQYYRLITELASDIERELKAQRARASSIGSGAAVRPRVATATVYLADVTEDLEDMRDGVKSYLNQAGFGILPGVNYPDDLDGYTSAIDADLVRSTIFVQLLSELPGRKVGVDGPRRAALRLERASNRNPPIPILLWRSRDLDWRRVTNEQHTKILKGEPVAGRAIEVMEVDIEEFKAAIKGRLTKPAAVPPERPPDRDYFLFINADVPDDDLSSELVRFIDASWSWVGYFPPRREGDPEEARAYLEQNLKDSDALLVIFGAAGPEWVTAQLQKARQIAAVRDRGPLKVAVYEGPPEQNKDKPIAKLPRMVRLNGRHGLNQVELGRFIESLRAT
jgi:hypothetical protein